MGVLAMQKYPPPRSRPVSDEIREIAIWVETIRAVLIEKGITTADELKDRHAKMAKFVNQQLIEVEKAAMDDWNARYMP
jgi:hypothetical protein